MLGQLVDFPLQQPRVCARRVGVLRCSGKVCSRFPPRLRDPPAFHRSIEYFSRAAALAPALRSPRFTTMRTSHVDSFASPRKFPDRAVREQPGFLHRILGLGVVLQDLRAVR